MRKVVIESPYAGDIEQNIKYARLCLKDSLERGESPICSHLLLTQVLDDSEPVEREFGIKAGLQWTDVADAHIFYVDYGISDGMMQALNKTTERINTPFMYLLGHNSPQSPTPTQLTITPRIHIEFRKILTNE